MPMLKKKEFRKTKEVNGFRDSEQVFHCVTTNEIFRDYDEFCARVILCNSMVWTCSYTGRDGLTYSEALESEKRAKDAVKDFPTDLQTPVLFIANETQKSSFHEMLEDVYGYVKDRYFIGENIQASFTGNKWHAAHIRQVIAPTSEKSPKNGQARYGPSATLYHYEVEQMNPDDEDLSEVMIVSYDHIRRTKKISRDKIKLFLKQCIQQNELGIFVIKPSVLEKFGIHNVTFDQIFDGSIPTFEMPKKQTRSDKRTRQASLVPFLQNKNDNSKSKPTANGVAGNSYNLLDKLKKRQEVFKQKKEDIKQQKAEQKIKEREENLKISRMLKEWHKPKYDLELEDHKLLPVPVPVATQIPEEHMGDALTILEFVKSFPKFLSVNSFFPGGLTLEIMERAIVQKEVAGPLVDLVQMFLTAIFNAQLEESSQYNTKLDYYSSVKKRDHNDNDNISLTEATLFATVASTWSNKCLGVPLNELPLYSLTTSEILRLHLLSSGARLNDTGAKWRYAYRGGFTSEDDPGLYFCLKYSNIIKALAVHSLTELPIEDVLKIIDCLMSQLLTYSDVRDQIEDELEKVRQAKFDYKAAQLAERKQDQEYSAAKWKIKKEFKEVTKRTIELDKLDKGHEKKKADINKKMSQLTSVVIKHQIYLGQDRAFRKYLKLNSIPGIFVNFEEDNPGHCYEECIQQYPNLVNAGRSGVLTHLRKLSDEANTSDKENILTNNLSNTNNIVNGQPESNSELNGEIESNGVLNGTVNGETHSNKPTSDPDNLLICNSNPATCLVHSSTVVRDKWSFINGTEQITEFVNSLNSRGIQESELKQTIQSDEQFFCKLADKTSLVLNLKPETTEDNHEDGSEPKPRIIKTRSKRYEDATLGYPNDLSTALILQYALVENILEMEAKIFGGNLGSIKVKDRNEWRTSLANHNYNFDKTLKREKVNKNREGGRKSRSNTPDLKEYVDPGKFLCTTGETKTEDSNVENTVLSQPSEDHNFAIQSLAYALAQVAESVEKRYLRKPLGNIGKNSGNKTSSELLDKWENSLLACTSYCQIFLHYSSLDSCILWSRSALLASCTVCRRKHDSDKMLLCDNCNRGSHLYCLKPKLKEVPEGDWFCTQCTIQKEAEEKLINPPETQRRRRIFVEEDETLEQSDVDSENQPLSARTQNRSRKRKASSDAAEPQLSKKNKRRRISTDSSEKSDQKSANGKYKRKPVAIIKEESSEESESEAEVDENDTQLEEEVEETAATSDEENHVEQQEENGDAENSEVEESEFEVNGASEDEIDENQEAEETAELENEDMMDMQNEDEELVNGERLEPAQNKVNGDDPVEVCEKCGIGGTLLCCDNCPELYHLECANPPLRRVPRGEWFCHKCKSTKKREDTDDDWYQSHSVAQRSGVLQNQRRCAARSRNTIYGYANILRRISKYEDNSRRSIRREDLPLNNAQLQELLTEVMKKEFSWPFLRPVNKTEVPDYYQIIQNPMDFGTIKYKLNMGQYNYDADLMADVGLVFENCKLYNNSEDEVFQCGLKMLQYFVDKAQALGLNVPHSLETREVLIDDDALSAKSDVEHMITE